MSPDGGRPAPRPRRPAGPPRHWHARCKPGARRAGHPRTPWYRSGGRGEPANPYPARRSSHRGHYESTEPRSTVWDCCTFGRQVKVSLVRAAEPKPLRCQRRPPRVRPAPPVAPGLGPPRFRRLARLAVRVGPSACVRVGYVSERGSPQGPQRAPAASESGCRRRSTGHSCWSARIAELGSNPTRGTLLSLIHISEPTRQ